MRHLRLAILAVVAVATLLILPADNGRATPGVGGTTVFSVQGIDPLHDISPGLVLPGVGCTSADILTTPGAGPVGPCLPRLAPALPGPVPFGVTGAAPDLGLNLGGPFTDDLQDLSFNEALGLAVDFDFSVDPAPLNAGVTVGAPLTPPCAPFVPNVTTEAGILEAQGDLFTTAGVPVGCNTQFLDEGPMGLIAPNPGAPGIAPLDNVDALAEFTFADGPGLCTDVATTIATTCAAYTVTPGSAVIPFVPPDGLTFAPVTGGTILAQPGTLPTPPGLPAGCPLGGTPCGAVSWLSLGLVPADDIDALCWFDVLPNGAPDVPIGALGPGSLGDLYVFSLTPASPSAAGLGGPASLIRAGAGPPVVVRTAASLGLLPTDNVDALICHDMDPDADLVPTFLDNCPAVPNPGQGNVDADALGDACDTEGPSPNANGLGGADDCFDGVDNNANGFTDAADPGCGDTDGDGIPDALDNCPTVPNPGQANIDLDAFGDACDTEGPSPNTSGLGGADDCFDGVDNDGDGLTDVPDTGCGDTDADGYSDEAEAGVPVCLGAVNDDNLDVGDVNVNDGCPAVGVAEVLCANAVDDDLDGRTNDGCPTVGLLPEGAYNIGTSAVGPCSVGVVPNPSPSWPSDFVSGGIPNSTDRITITDLTSFLAPVRRFNTRPDVAPPPGSAFSARWDLVPGRGLFPNWIVINDITALIAGSSGNPPMFGGIRAFNGPACVGP